jgi:hypothetical protein
MRAVEELRMLSNYQLGNHSLLQSFLLGQPEFRRILQRPEMEQFRQRVAATCHIGPMDLEDTQQYIEHRLRCADAAPGKPEFEGGVIERVHLASGGIPRRINALCDRLLLLGYLSGSTRLTLADIEQVIAEFASEAALPNGAGTLLPEDMPLLTGTGRPAAQEVSRLIEQHNDDRLQRLEHSLLRLEHINLQTLALLQRLLGAAGEGRATDQTKENEA